MSTVVNKTVGELAAENPNATRVLEKLGIDYCCGGHRPIEQACSESGVGIEKLLSALSAADQKAGNQDSQKSWQNESLSALIAHIVSTHHVYVKEEVPRLQQLAAKVVAAHGARHPELSQVQEIVADLGQELFMHLMKEEQILFPYVEQAERNANQGGPGPSSCFGTVQNPIRMMEMEHDSAGTALRELRQITSDYAIPADACVSYRTLYEALQAFEADLHQHIHLENNILFPRAIVLESAA